MATKKETRGRKTIYNTERKKKKAHQLQVNKSLKKTMTAFTFRFHNENDQQVLEKLQSVSNKADYIRQLVLEDIKKGNN